MMALFIGKTDVRQLPSYVAQNYALIEEKITRLIFAPHCVMCNTHTDHSIALCNQCWGKLDFEIPLYLCKQCGFPMNDNDEHADWDSLCLSCLQKPSLLDGTAATLAYDGVSRDLILKFKQNDALYLRKLLTYLLTLAVHRLPEADMIIPVPLHRWRLWGRRYNQSALLAFALAKLLHSDNVQTGILQRIRYTKKQKGNPSQRATNLRNAFAVSAQKKHLLKGKKILLIDDVLTTSATLENCAKTLKKAGADKVYGLTVARVVAPRPIFAR
ncbi:MAG: ComF family protein [Alphaproteobacteria bacterium]|nr:ComF family protein [Alphaproteobacteria bacterium]